jgi:hypothetical protein
MDNAGDIMAQVEVCLAFLSLLESSCSSSYFSLALGSMEFSIDSMP